MGNIENESTEKDGTRHDNPNHAGMSSHKRRLRASQDSLGYDTEGMPLVGTALSVIQKLKNERNKRPAK